MRLNKSLLIICLMMIVAAPVWAQRGAKNRSGERACIGDCLLRQASASTQPLSIDEAEYLAFMREEEKLARDVYQALSVKWGVRIFNNIAASEQRHFDSVGILLERYGLTDSAQPAAGVFSDPDLQKLYGELVAKGAVSLLDAMEVGVIIEEKDIKDLKAAMALADNTDLLRVFGNLLQGSLNHLAAFKSNIEVLRAAK
jgi:hypothetical protein